ncbi:hypothetical protein DFH09DRAFT_908163 [Mycena vulgaris]|nr:hypothetical protein DFH09DRAFT_908163 [Mycena vulgaris]
MTRGRKKDHTIPQTRALTLQRDYRARKSQYIAELEARCKAAEEENVRLKKELELARQGAPKSASRSEMIQASAQLKDALSAASASLSHFMQVALPSDQKTQATPPSFTSLLETLSSAAVLAQSTDADTLNNAASSGCHPTPPAPVRSNSPCCGGYIDCEHLVEDEFPYPPPDDNQLSSIAVISQLRSTSDFD